MSQTVFGLLLGWLTDGTGPVAGGGAADGVGLEGPEAPARCGREAMLKIVNERCRIQGKCNVNSRRVPLRRTKAYESHAFSRVS